MSRQGLIGILVVGALAFAGCGDSGDSTTSSLTKAAFIKKGDAICVRTEEERGKKITAFREANPGQSDATQLELIKDVAIPPVREMADELEELGPPDEEAQAVIDGIRAATEKIEESPILALEVGAGPLAKVGKQAKAYGFKTCGQY